MLINNHFFINDINIIIKIIGIKFKNILEILSVIYNLQGRFINITLLQILWNN